jgi:hypothetical protein
MAADAKNPLGDDWILLEIDGPDLRPDKIDVRAALTVAHRYVDLMAALADDDAADLDFTGLRVIDKCVAFAFKANEPDLARREAKRALRCVTGQEQPPKGAVIASRELKEALRALPANQVARVIAGGFRQDLRAAAIVPSIAPESRISLRATPIRVGGSRPAVRFESKSEDRPFTLDVERDRARLVGRFLYSEIDIEALVTRDEEGFIELGRLLGFEPVTDDDATTAWRDWYVRHASGWNSIADVESELGRGRD